MKTRKLEAFWLTILIGLMAPFGARAADYYDIDFEIIVSSSNQWEIQIGDYTLPGTGDVTNYHTMRVERGVTNEIRVSVLPGGDMSAMITPTNISCLALDFMVLAFPYLVEGNETWDVFDWVDGPTAHAGEMYATGEATNTGVFGFCVTTNSPYIRFDTPCQTVPPNLPADGESTAQAWLVNGSQFEAPITWTLETNMLGCSIIASNGVITAGNQSGTLTVRATSTNGCSVVGYLEVGRPNGGCSGPGCAGGSEGLIGTGSVESENVNVQLNLGESAFGESAGSFGMLAETPSTELYTPASLEYLWLNRPDVETFTDGNGDLQQIKALQGLADIETLSANSFSVKFYRPEDLGTPGPNGYPINQEATPFATWVFANPDAGSTNRLRITETNAQNQVNIYEYSWLTNGWELHQYERRKEVFTWSWSTNGANHAVRTETREVQETNGTVVSIVTNRFEVFPVGERVIERARGRDSAAVVDSYQYYDTGLLKQVVRGDGSWAYCEYDTQGRKTAVLTPFLTQGLTTNSALCRATLYDYDPGTVSGTGDSGVYFPNQPRKITEKITNQVVGLRYQAFTAGQRLDFVCLGPTDDYDSAGVLQTDNRFYTGGWADGYPRSVLHPDGTAEFYTYSRGAQQTNVVERGEADGANEWIAQGQRSTTVLGSAGELVLEKVERVVTVSSAFTLQSSSYSNHDDYGRARTVIFNDGTSNSWSYACCGEQTFTNQEGTVTIKTYDAVGRLSSTAQDGLTQYYYYDAAGQLTNTTRVGSDQSSVIVSRRGYDTAGRLLKETNALEQVMSYSETVTNGVVIATATYPNSRSRIEIRNRDGTLNKITGDMVHASRYEYGALSSGWTFTKEIKVDSNDDDLNEWTVTYQDMAGRTCQRAYAAASAPYPNEQYEFTEEGQRLRAIDPDGVTTLYQYNPAGDLEYTAVSATGSSATSIDFQNDRVTRVVETAADNEHGQVRQRLSYVWPTAGQDQPSLIFKAEVSLDSPVSWSTRYGLVTTNLTGYAGGGTRHEIALAPDGTKTTNEYANGRLVSVLRKDRDGNTLEALAYGYDAHRRLSSVTNQGTSLVTTYLYDWLDRATNATLSAPGVASQSTLSYFDNLGRVWKQVLPDNTCVTNEYQDTGELTKTYGSRTYPVGYSFDEAGRLETMTTWQNFAESSGLAQTTWKYDGYRGWLTNKIYQTTNGPSYTYTLGRRLKTRTWARGVTTTYSTNHVGDIIGVDYSDTTPDVSFGRDRQGRVIAVTNGTSTTSLSYNETGQVLSETRDGLAVTNAYDSLLRLSAVGYDGANANPAQYGYDAASRLSTLTHGLNTGTYNYVENSSLIADIQFRTNGNLRMSANRQYDNLDRLTSVSNQDANGAVLRSFAYAYNLANQRTNVTMAGTTPIGPGSWSYSYDELGQVTNAVRKWPDGVLVAGQQFAYDFDDIGNRLWTKAGGDASGGGMRLANYTNNLLNQITGRGVPGTNDVIGIAHASATVTINGQSTYRKGEYYQLAIGTNNTSPVSLWVTNLATLGTNSQSVTGRFFLASAGQHFSYDADGNLLTNSRSYYYWDADNRLKLVIGWYPSDARFRVDCTYDYMHRRVSKSVSNWTGSTFLLDYQRKFVYQGWNLVAELDGTNGLVKTHHWGIDAGGTMQGAGGVGGLLATVFHTGQYAGTYFPAYDGNWNICKYIRASDGAVVAEYEHGPFGELIRASGPLAKEFNFLFSTKYYDWETRLYYYGYRYYDPSTGRWLSDDPLGERGAINLGAFCQNESIQTFDSDGRIICELGPLWSQNIPPAPSYNDLLNNSKVEPWQLKKWQNESKMKFLAALRRLCPKDGDISTFSYVTRNCRCDRQSCLKQAQELADALADAYRKVFMAQIARFGDVAGGHMQNSRCADNVPSDFTGQESSFGMNPANAVYGCGLKCMGWQDLFTDVFDKTLVKYLVGDNKTLCFRAKRVGKPQNDKSVWNHGWIYIYGPQRRDIDTNWQEYDIMVDPWPSGGLDILGDPHQFKAVREDGNVI